MARLNSKTGALQYGFEPFLSRQEDEEYQPYEPPDTGGGGETPPPEETPGGGETTGPPETNPIETAPAPVPINGAGAPPSPYSGGGGSAGPSGAGSQLSQLLRGMIGRVSGGNPYGAFKDTYAQSLRDLIARYSAPVDPNSSSIRRRVSAREGKNARALQDWRALAAERAHAEGVPTGAFDSALGNATLASGRDVGDYESNLIADEEAQNRAALAQIMGQAGGFIGGENQYGLGEQGQTLDALLKQMGIDLDREKFQGSQALGYAGIGAQNRATDLANQHFYDDLTYRMGKDQSGIDDLIMQLLLGGGGG